MSIVHPTLLSLGRAAVIALATFVVLLLLGPGVRGTSRRWRTRIFWLAAAALFTPGFVIGFLYLKPSPDEQWMGPETAYTLLVWSRLSLVAILIAGLLPPAISDEASHCIALTGANWRKVILAEIRAWGPGIWLAVALVFLLAFQEFDIATTWNMRAWTVALFDAQAGGLALSETLHLAAPPFAVQTVLIAALVFASRHHRHSTVFTAAETRRSFIALLPCSLAFSFICLPALFTPILAIRQFTLKGWEVLASAPTKEIISTLALSLSAVLITWPLAGWIEKRRGWRWALALPGLLGPLLCGLLLLALIQLPPLHLLRDTVFPTVIGLALVLLPYALLLRFGIETTRDGAALHIARVSGGRSAVWQLDGWPRLCAVLMLFCFGYGDFTINSLLAPPQFTSASVRLLNLLHYGRSSALMVMFLLAFAVPLSAALLTVIVARLYPHRRAS